MTSNNDNKNKSSSTTTNSGISGTKEAIENSSSSSSSSSGGGIGIPPIVIFSVCLAASAGFTLYTKRASSMLRTMEQVTERQKLRNPPRIGPPTKEEWEKIRPRWSDDDTI